MMNLESLPFRNVFPFVNAAADAFALNFSSYRPWVSLEIPTQRYLIRTAKNGEDLCQVLRLRHQVFYEELLGRSHPSGMDMDRFDRLFDHMMLLEKESGKLVGTYRLNCSSFNCKSYTETEFDCQSLRRLPGSRLELGRACLHPDHRNGALFILLWRGILDYAARTDSRFLYGCASIKTTDSRAAYAIYRELSTQYGCDPKWHIRPRKEFGLPGWGSMKWARENLDFGLDSMELVPSLLWFYFRAGARICGQPALDRDFKCIDFPVLLDMKDALQSITQRMT